MLSFQHHLSTVGTPLYTTETQCGREGTFQLIKGLVTIWDFHIALQPNNLSYFKL